MGCENASSLKSAQSTRTERRWRTDVLCALKLEITESIVMQHMNSAIATMHQLKALGCDHGQGFFLARPVPARVITNLLAAGDSLLRPLVDPAATVA